MIDEHREEQVCLYALGILPWGEVDEFEEALNADQELRQLLLELSVVTDGLAVTIPYIQPPSDLKHAILSKLGQQKPYFKRSSSQEARKNKDLFLWVFSPWLPGLLVACLVMVCLLLWERTNRLEEKTAEANHQVTTLQNQVVLLEKELFELRGKDYFAQLHIMRLNSLLENSPKAVAVSVWNPEQKKGILLAENLDPLPADKDYQLWVIDSKRPNPISAGVFRVDRKGSVRFEFRPKIFVTTFDKIAVTKERKGGVPQPEGTMVLLGS